MSRFSFIFSMLKHLTLTKSLLMGKKGKIFLMIMNDKQSNISEVDFKFGSK